MTTKNCISIRALLFVAVFDFTVAILDFDELKSIYYGIDILDKPLLLQNEPPNDAVILSSKYGQLYQCTHPPVLSLQDQKQADYKARNSSVVELLSPLKTRSCLSYTKGWWTYEFCYGREIKQYHAEDGKIVGDVIFLGNFESDFDWSNASAKLSQKQKSAERYHSQTYVNGSYCELIDKARTTEARFICQEGHGDYIAGVDERETCSYVMTVHTSRICSHPQFGPPTSMKTVTISCNPLLTVSEYEIYIQDAESSDKVAAETSTPSNTEKEEELLPQQSSEDLQKLFVDSLLSSMQAMLTGQQKDTDVMASSSVEDTSLTASAEDATVHEVSDNVDSSTVEADGASLAASVLDASSDVHTELTAEHDVRKDADSVSISDGNVDSNNDNDDDDGNSGIGDGNGSAAVTEDDELVQEFDKELNEIASTALKKAHLAKYKDSIKSSVESQFSDLMDEAKADMQRQGDDTAAVDTQDAFQKLAQTLNILLERLEKLDTTGDLGGDLASEVTKEAVEDADGFKGLGDLNEDASKSDDKSHVEDDADEQQDTETDGSIKVKVKFLKKPVTASSDKHGETSKQSDTAHDADSSTELQQPVENRLRDRLEQAGLKTAGHKVEFRILTTGYYNSKDSSIHTLSDEDGSAFSKVIIAIIGGDDAETTEQERHQRLEENYRFKWDNNKNKNQQSQPVNV
jgi:protein OS-9